MGDSTNVKCLELAVAESLRASEERLREAQRIARIGSWELDLVHDRLLWSEEIYRIFGLDPEGFDPSYLAFLERIHPEDRDDVHKAYTLSVRTRTPYEIEHRLLMTDGRVKHVAERGQTFYDEAGDPVRSAGTVQDITERKEQQEELRRHQEHLEAVVAERTRDLVARNLELAGEVAERRRVEDELRKLSRAMEASRATVVITDLTGSIEYVNRAFTEITGYSSGEVCGRNARILKSGHHPPVFYADMWRTIRTGQVWQGELCNRKKNGELFWERSSISPVRGEAGAITHFVAVKEDVTALIRTNELIEVQHEVTRVLAQSRTLTDGINQLLETIGAGTHWDCGEFWLNEGDHLAQVASWHSLGPAGDAFVAAGGGLTFAAGTGLPGIAWAQGPVWSADAAREPYFCRAQALRSAGLHAAVAFPLSAATRVTGVMTLFSRGIKPVDGELLSMLQILGSQIGQFVERMHAEESLAESEEKTRAFAESAIYAVALMDNDGAISYWNPAAERMFGYSSAEALGKNLHSLLAPARFHQAAETASALFRRTGEGDCIGKTVEFAGRRRDGGEFPMELSLSAVKLKGKWHAVGIIQDVTERKHAERELQEAREAAESANRAKSDFLAKMSHELRTPLNAVIGFARMLNDGDVGEVTIPQQEYLRDILESGKHLLHLINEILDIAKIEAGKTELEVEDFPLDSLLDETVFMFRGMAAAKNISLEVRNLFGSGEIAGDRYKIKQVLVNLLANAFHVTPGHGCVTLTAEMQSPCAGCEPAVELSVRDTGPGISPEEISRLFVPFQQLASHGAAGHDGTGLGLTICKTLVELHGGTIRVTSERGRGALFTFSIPLRTGRFQVDDVPHRSPTTIPADDHHYPLAAKDSLSSRGVVLLAEDHPVNQKLTMRQLNLLGCTVAVASNGQEAFEAWQRGGHDLLLTDCHMPVMDGYQLAARIREAEKGGRRMPIIALTANALRGESERCRESGMDGYLAKPVYLETLHATLDQWLPVATPAPPEEEPLPVATEHCLLDPQALTEVFGDDAVAIRETLLEFIAISEEDVSALVAAADARRAYDMALVAHRIKGAARIIGARQLAEVCKQLSMAGRNEEWERILHLLPHFLRGVDELRTAVGAMVAKPPFS